MAKIKTTQQEVAEKIQEIEALLSVLKERNKDQRFVAVQDFASAIKSTADAILEATKHE